MPAGEVEGDRRRRPGRRSQREHWRRAAADLEHPAAGDVAEQARVGLAQPLRAPDEVGVAEEVAVLGLVVVGLGVPPARGWRAAVSGWPASRGDGYAVRRCAGSVAASSLVTRSVSRADAL